MTDTLFSFSFLAVCVYVCMCVCFFDLTVKGFFDLKKQQDVSSSGHRCYSVEIAFITKAFTSKSMSKAFITRTFNLATV